MNITEHGIRPRERANSSGHLGASKKYGWVFYTTVCLWNHVLCDPKRTESSVGYRVQHRPTTRSDGSEGLSPSSLPAPAQFSAHVRSYTLKPAISIYQIVVRKKRSHRGSVVPYSRLSWELLQEMPFKVQRRVRPACSPAQQTGKCNIGRSPWHHCLWSS